MRIEPVAKTYVTGEVAEKLKEFVLGGTYRPGDRLPSIKEFATQLGVGQTTVREALRRLESLGLIQILHGSGIYVRETARVPLSVNPIISSAPLDERMLHDLISVRRILETGAAELAAAQADPAKVEALQRLLVEMEQTLDQPDAFSRHNTDFHVAVAECSGNQILPLFLRAVRDLIVRHQERLNESPEVRTRSLSFHRRIFAAIAAGDPDAAKTAMAEHLADVQAALVERPGNG